MQVPVCRMTTSSIHIEDDRVRRHTSEEAAAAIDAKTRRHIREHAPKPPRDLEARIRHLERERDMEQVLETNAGILALAGALLGTTVHKGFFGLTAVVLGFLTQHATTGWCPPVPIFRSMGVRTRAEINQERYALKALRGDFRDIHSADPVETADRALAAVQ